jgi:hypothetical protein
MSIRLGGTCRTRNNYACKGYPTFVRNIIYDFDATTVEGIPLATASDLCRFVENFARTQFVNGLRTYDAQLRQTTGLDEQQEVERFFVVHVLADTKAYFQQHPVSIDNAWEDSFFNYRMSLKASRESLIAKVRDFCTSCESDW